MNIMLRMPQVTVNLVPLKSDSDDKSDNTDDQTNKSQ